MAYGYRQRPIDGVFTTYALAGGPAMSSQITDERLAELEAMVRNVAEAIVSRNADPGAWPDVAAALRELQQWRSGVEPSTGAPIGRFVVMQPWDEPTD
jgi:hypothetical protein